MGRTCIAVTGGCNAGVKRERKTDVAYHGHTNAPDDAFLVVSLLVVWLSDILLREGALLGLRRARRLFPPRRADWIINDAPSRKACIWGVLWQVAAANSKHSALASNSADHALATSTQCTLGISIRDAFRIRLFASVLDLCEQDRIPAWRPQLHELMPSACPKTLCNGCNSAPKSGSSQEVIPIAAQVLSTIRAAGVHSYWIDRIDGVLCSV